MSQSILEIITEQVGVCKLVSASVAGLDSRIGNIYVGVDFVATENPEMLDYFAGFEYHDDKDETPLYKVYFAEYGAEDDRVSEVLHNVKTNK